MRDWKKQVGDRLAALQLAPEVREEVIAELSSHLEDGEADGAIHGAPLSDAQWKRLSKTIECTKRQEVVMNHRTKTLWIPGMASLLGASLIMTLLQWVGVRPRLVWVDSNMAMTFYWPWLVALPIFGGMGAYLSQRAGGEIRTRLVAGLLPVVWLFLLTVALFPVEMAHQGFNLLSIRYYALGMTNWVGVPALALLLGELPFLRAPRAVAA